MARVRLYDTLIGLRGTRQDKRLGGAYSSIARDLGAAECFELGPDVVEACHQVAASRPSTILSALPFCRLPYPTTWFEWTPIGGDDELRQGAVRPDKLGCLVKASPTGEMGLASWAWRVETGSVPREQAHLAQILAAGGMLTSLSGLAVAFDFSVNLERPLQERLVEAFCAGAGAEVPPIATYRWQKPDAEETRKHLHATLGRPRTNDREIDAIAEMAQRARVVPNAHLPRVPSRAEMEELVDDIAGELPFLQAFLLMLNSKSILQRSTEDLSAANRVRRRLSRRPLKEFITTGLRLTRTTLNRAAAAGLTGEQVRRHLVMGHFKVRRSGIFWWFPHLRGTGSPVLRTRYQVRT